MTDPAPPPPARPRPSADPNLPRTQALLQRAASRFPPAPQPPTAAPSAHLHA